MAFIDAGLHATKAVDMWVEQGKVCDDLINLDSLAQDCYLSLAQNVRGATDAQEGLVLIQ